MFGNLTTDGLEKAEDTLGRGQRLPTDVYPLLLKMVYVTKSKGGATAINIIGSINGQDYTENGIYITNKAGENFSVNDAGKKVPLPSFTMINNLCRLVLGKELSQIVPEDKVIKVYDFEEKKEVNKTLPVIVELCGVEVPVAVSDIIENKNVETRPGVYEATAETREFNQVQHFFDPTTGQTYNEKAEGKDAGFLTRWKEKYAGKQNDRRKVKDGQAGAAKSGRPQAAGGSSAPAATSAASASLFNKAPDA